MCAMGGVPANLVFPEGGGVDAKLVGEVLADTAVRATDIDEAQVRKAKEEAERVLAHKDPKMSVE